MDWREAQQISNAAYVIGMAVSAMFEVQGMAAENQMRAINGESPAYTEADFLKRQQELGMHYNGIVTNLHQNL